MRTDLFDYHLPPEQIAQTPLPRGQSRLLVLHREQDRREHRAFCDIIEYLESGDTLVLNDTRVTARRLQGYRESGEPAEVFLLKPVGEKAWEALVRPGKSLRIGKTITLQNSEGEPLVAEVVGVTDEGGRILEFPSPALRDEIAHWGVAPLPPYIQTPLPTDQEERYQTVYAREGGSAAAPTAGLHFTPELLQAIQEKGISLAYVTLHVGVGTFRPVRAENIEEHTLHHETFTLSQENAAIINQTQGRVIAVGTTSVRTLETIGAQAPPNLRVVARSGDTQLFIKPGDTFRVVDAIVTNFHLPKSTLLMLISAFATREQILASYAEAIEAKYRFFSFGDAMLIL